MTATGVTRETLDGTPVRVLTFLRAAGTSLSIRRLLASKGYTPADHKEGWALLHKVSGLTSTDLAEETDTAVRDAINTLDNTDEDFYRLVRSGLTRLHPEQAAFALDGLAPSTGTASVLAVKNLLDRIDTLEEGRSKESAKADKAAVATLAQRGVNAAERERLRQLVKIAESASEVAPAEDTSASDEQFLKDLIALRAWFEDWSEVARVAIKRKDYLIRLGLASRKSSKKDPPAALGAPRASDALWGLPTRPGWPSTRPGSFRRARGGHRRNQDGLRRAPGAIRRRTHRLDPRARGRFWLSRRVSSGTPRATAARPRPIWPRPRASGPRREPPGRRSGWFCYPAPPMASHPLVAFLGDIRATLATGANTKETSFYPALRELLNAVGKGLGPQVFAVMNLKNQGGGLPDGGLFSADQLPSAKKNSQPEEDALKGVKPSRGAIEVKGLSVELNKLIASEQVGRYLDAYGHVLVTNLRSFALVHGDSQHRNVFERYDLASDESGFRVLLRDHDAIALQEERFCDFLRRAMKLPAPLREPEDVAWFLASYARDALAELEVTDISEFNSIASNLELALGVGFGFDDDPTRSEADRKKAHHFFRSVLVQTLFYGVFSAWVLHCRQKSSEPFVWRNTSDLLHLTLLQRLFHEMSQPSTLFSHAIKQKLDLAQETLNRVEKAAFFERFREHEAVQYFYEPFLEAFDPELRKELGVWYTPDEIVRYMVERVDLALRNDLGIAEGLASDEVCVLDPCCGTGAFLVAVLQRIHQNLIEAGEESLAPARVARAAMTRLFGFELLPASFVVAHLQISLFLSEIGAQIPREKRAAVYLTNALTGWEKETAVQQNLWAALKEERNAASEIKQKRKILVILGNPPYNAFAGVQPREEQESVDLYKEGLSQRWKIRKFNLDDLYVRFLRVAERKIIEQSGRGIVCFISNASYLSDKSFVVLRRRLLDEFDQITIDNLNGDSFETGKKTPDGEADPSVFSTKANPEGIKVGTAIALMQRTGAKHGPGHRAYIRWLDFWGKSKRNDLLASLASPTSAYRISEPSEERFWSFKPDKSSASSQTRYLKWPRTTALCQQAPISGLAEKRKGGLIGMDRESISDRMRTYFDSTKDWSTVRPILGGLGENAADYKAEATRNKLVKSKEIVSNESFKKYAYLPMDTRWCYHTLLPSLWNRARPELVKQHWGGNSFLITRTASRRPEEGKCVWLTTAIPDHHFLDPNVVAIPLRWREEHLSDATVVANLSEGARVYLAWQGVFEPDDGEEEATRLWYHALAMTFSPAWQQENASGILEDFPRIPLPERGEWLLKGAALGRRLADLVDPDVPVPGVTQGKLRPELLALGKLRRSDGKAIEPQEGDLGVENRWGAIQRETVVMPGPGKTTVVSAEALPKAHPLGADMVDVWLNKQVVLHAVPRQVWEFTVGGYQVIKKWLSYRERSILGRDLTLDEASHLSGMVRRIAAILLMSAELDEVYQGSRDAFVPWNDLHGEGATARFRFVKLALDWTRATGALSSRQEKFAHPAYAAIQKLGRAIVPDVLRWIALGGAGHWDELLFELTGARPEPPGDERDLEAIHRAWIAWGRSQKLLPEAP